MDSGLKRGKSTIFHQRKFLQSTQNWWPKSAPHSQPNTNAECRLSQQATRQASASHGLCKPAKPTPYWMTHRHQHLGSTQPLRPVVLIVLNSPSVSLPRTLSTACTAARSLGCASASKTRLTQQAMTRLHSKRLT